MSRLTKETLDGLVNVGFSRSEYRDLIKVLRERMLAEPIDPNERIDHGKWYCNVCGSTNVHGTAWVYFNDGPDHEAGDDTGSEAPSDDSWCSDCEEHDTARYADPGDEPLFCKCLAESEAGEVPEATWGATLKDGWTTCDGCGAAYTYARPAQPKRAELG